MLRTLLVDDEPLALKRLEAFLDDIEGVEVVGTAADGKEAIEQIERLKPDLAILDIQMPEQNGLRVAASLPQQGAPEVIFVTAFEQYAPDAFEVDAADYLLKPVRFDRLRQAVERAKRREYLRSMAGRAEAAESDQRERHSHEDGIWVPTPGGSVFVPIETIDWIEAQRDYVMLHTQTRSYILRISMRALEAKLDSSQLMRVHRSAFARPAQVVEVQRLGKTIVALVLKDGAIVQVGPNYSRAVAERLRLF